MTVLKPAPVQLTADFAKQFSGLLDKFTLKRAAQQLERSTQNGLRTQTPIDAESSFSSLIYYIKIRCAVDGGRSFSGRIWGQGLVHNGLLCGDIYLTEGFSIDDVYRRTCEFTFATTPGYSAVYFFDFNQILVGHFQAGPLAKIFAAGKGEGSWH